MTFYQRPNSRFIWYQYYLPGKRNKPQRGSTGVVWSDDFNPTLPNWLDKRSDPRVQRIKSIIKAIELQQGEVRFKQKFPHLVEAKEQEATKSYTFRKLAELYIADKAARRSPLDPSSVFLYNHAVNLIESFQPGAGLKDLNKDFVKRFNKFIYTTKFKEATLNIYIGKLRTLVRFAIEEEWATSNPLTAIKIKVPKVQAPVHDDFEEEIEYIRWAWSRKPDFVLHYLYERLTGFRAGDSTYLKWSDVKTNTLEGYNEKLRRQEPWPIHNALRLLLKLAKKLYPGSEYVFPLRSYDQIRTRHLTLWKEYRMAKRGTHNWKRNYTVDIDEAEPPHEVGKYLKHHAPDELNSRYAGRPMAKMLKYSNLALDKFIPILEELVSTLQTH